jgi:hypothetical protein
MELASSSVIFISPEMHDLDRCRLYLQVFFVSDLADVTGVHVEAWETKGRRSYTRTSE